MSRIGATLLTATVLGLIWSAAASASAWPFKAPRLCASPNTRSQCLAGAAEIAVVRQYGHTHTFLSFKCQTVGPLKAVCPTNSAAGQIVYTVAFSKSQGRWWVKVTP